MMVFLPAYWTLMLIHRLAFWLDDLLFPGWRNTPVEQPLFIVGIPRSGTSHLFQVLSKDTERFTYLTLWELIFAPSILERKIILFIVKLDQRIGSPLEKLLNILQQKLFSGMEDIHELDFSQPEEDYFLLLPEMACFLLIHPFPFPEVWRIGFWDRALSRKEQDALFARYRERLQRHLYFHGFKKTLLSKNPAFSGAVFSLHRTFPDARFIFTTRPPVKAVPSLVSSMMEGVRMFGNSTGGHRYRNQLMKMLKFFYENLLRATEQFSPEKYSVVPMKKLTGDLEKTVRHVYLHFQFSVSKEFENRLIDEVEKSKAYKSKHRHSLEEFGLTELKVNRYMGQAPARLEALGVDQ